MTGPRMIHKVVDIATDTRCQMLDVTRTIDRFLTESGARSGILLVGSPHTTAGVTINENADPDVQRDILQHLERMVPENAGFRHAEGNSDAHIKTLLTGTSVQLPVVRGKTQLGTWQSVFFCEFDGPRHRRLQLTFLPENPA